jgi:hypothetical protein
MEGTNSDSAEQHPADACQDCGSPEVQHRSLMRREDDHEEVIVVLCEDCHRARLRRAHAFDWT